MNDQQKGSGWTIAIIVVAILVLLGSCGSSSSDDDARDAFNKWYTGDYDSMTDYDKNYIEGFLNWANDN